MGKKIDRLFIFSALITLIYAIFIHAFHSIPIACLLTFLCCAAIRRFSLRNKRPASMSAYDARQLLDRWGYESEETVRPFMEELVHPSSAGLACIIRPLAFSVSKGDVLAQWKSNREKERIVIAATCYADGSAKTFAASLRSPTVEIADAARLIPLLRHSSIKPLPRPPFSGILHRLRILFSSLPMRRSWQKNAMSGLMLMALYLLSGNAAYLFLSIGLLFLSGLSLRRT